MNDRWFEELIRVAKEDDARDRQELDERWDRLAAGTLSDEEEAALRAEAELTEEGRAAWEAFRPLGSAFESSVVAAIEASIETGRAKAAPAPVVAIGPIGSGRGSRAPRSRRGSRAPLFAAAGLLAAGLVAFALLRPFLDPPLPNYTDEISTGDRGSDKQIVIGRLTNIGLQPDESRRGRVAVQCVLTPTGEDPRFWPGCEIYLKPKTDGTVKGQLPPDATAELTPGTLRVIVGRPGRFPPLKNTEERDPDGRWQAFEYPVRPAGP